MSEHDILKESVSTHLSRFNLQVLWGKWCSDRFKFERVLLVSDGKDTHKCRLGYYRGAAWLHEEKKDTFTPETLHDLTVLVKSVGEALWRAA